MDQDQRSVSEQEQTETAAQSESVSRRDIGICAALSIMSFGLYFIYWLYLLVRNTRVIKKDDSSFMGEFLCLIFVPFYNLYWWYTRGKRMREEFSRQGINANGNEVIYLILGIFGLSIVSAAIMQNDFNQTDPDPVNDFKAGNILVSFYLMVMLGVFPLFLTAQYAHARTDKYYFYLAVSLYFTVVTGICALIVWFVRLPYRQQVVDGQAGGKSAFSKLTVPDILILSFWGLALISAIMSPQRDLILTGNIARNNGMPLLTMYVIVYFFITRCPAYRNYVLCVYLGLAIIVSGLTILNFYNIDPLNVYAGYGGKTLEDFGSTIGNKNMISSYMCLYLPAAVMSFTVTKSRYLKVISGIAICFAYGGLLCANSTSDIFGLVIILPVMLIFSARSLKTLRSFMLALTILFASGKLLQLFATATGDNNKGFEFIQGFLVYSPSGFILPAVCAALYLMLRFAVKEEHYPAKAAQIILGVFFGACAAAALSAMIYFSVFDLETDLGSFEKLLRFNDAWGTHRGFMWRMSLEEYGKMPFIKKLFGSGPDTLYYVFMPHFEELNSRFGDPTTDAAHSEFINYLVTHGALGLCAYLGFVGAVIVRGIRAAKRKPIALVFVSAVICYLAQATVNLYSPIVTPMFFIFLSLTESVSREVTRNKKS